MTGRLVGQSHAPRPATPTFSWHVPVVVLLSIACLSWLPLRAQSDRSPLIDATRAQEIDTVRTLILSGADVTARQGDGATALHWAVHWEHPVLVNLLLQAGGNADAANDLGMTPLLMATARGNSRIVQALLDAGADVTHRAQGGETPLMLAARVGDLDSVENLLAAGAPVNATEDTRGQSALMWAAANAYPRIVAVLLEHGADIESRSRVSSRVFNMGGSRSAGSASRGIRLEAVPQGGGTPLLFAARSGDPESARLLLDHGADANDAAADGNTALAIAAHSGNASVATTLLVAGADPNLAPLGYTPLHAAVLRGTLVDRGVQNPDPHAGVPLLRELLAYGADPNAQLMRGTPVRRWSHDFALMERWVGATPYWLAAKFLEPEMMQLLAASGANTQLASRDGTTPLMAASGLGYSRGGGSAFIKDRRDFSSYNPV
ncbi:MAG: ankyrin repeat domain-containing protein, partial [Acidobacteriota bacterium]|nr:ankyrin repeat domain-containing protein [Acidobacteriota bacterium]